MPDLDSKKVAQAIYREVKVLAPLKGEQYVALFNVLRSVAANICVELEGTELNRQQFLSICMTGKVEDA